MQTTVTEALAELKTISKRKDKKREFIARYLARQDIVKDPLEKDGGSVTAIAQEIQAINDLQNRILAIRAAITRSNLDTKLTVCGLTMTVHDWLVWRREIAPGIQSFLGGLTTTIEALRREVKKKGGQIVESGGGSGDNDVVVNVSEMTLASEIEGLEQVLGTLDGLLSLTNATTIIDI